MELKNKNVIVTGGVNGIGKRLVEELCSEGAIVGVLDLDEKGLRELDGNHKNIYGIQCNVTDAEQVSRAVGRFFDQVGEIHVLINNAGIIYSAPLIALTPTGITKHDIAAWDKVIATDLSSLFYVTVNVIEKMVLKRTKGTVVNISSVCAAGNQGQSAYSAAKAGVNALTATWAKELALLGIRVVGVAPGFFDTESTRRSLKDDVLKEIVKKIPARRLGNLDEIARGVISLIKNDYFNGKVFEIDGGLVI
jgi:3-oxoacyl-[acyl-carrier protein] reductase